MNQVMLIVDVYRTFEPCVSDRRIVNDLHFPAGFGYVEEAITESRHTSMHRVFDDGMAMINTVEQNQTGREDGDPEDVGLSEKQAEDSKRDQNKRGCY